MAGARRKSGSKGRARKRDKNGHFVSAARKAARRTAKANPRERAKKRSAAKRRTVVRIKRALGRKKKTGQFTRRSKHRVRGYRRKVKGRSAKKLVRSHLSYEAAPVKRRRARRATEASMAQKNPRRRTKRRRNPVVVMENHRPRKKKRKAARKAPRRAKRRTVSASGPITIRRRKTSRRGGGSARDIKVSIVGLAPARRKPRRAKRKSAKRSSYKKRKSARRGRKSSHRSGSYTPASHQLAAEGWFANPLGANFLENPLSGGELALATVTGAVGYVLTDLLDRYLAISQYATTSAGGITIQPSAAVRTKPNMTRILAQAAAAAVPLGAAYFVKEPLGRAALQGMGLGAAFHIGGQLVSHYLMTYLGTKIVSLKPYYQMETQADSYADAYNGVALPTGVTPLPSGSTLAGLAKVQQLAAPTGVGRPNVLRRPAAPSIPFNNPGPTATGVAALPTTGVGDCGCDPEPTMPVPNGGGSGPCDPCDGSTQPPAAPPGRSAMSGLQGLGSPYAMFDAAE